MFEDLGFLWIIGAFIAGLVIGPAALFLYIIQDNDDL